MCNVKPTLCAQRAEIYNARWINFIWAKIENVEINWKFVIHLCNFELFLMLGKISRSKNKYYGRLLWSAIHLSCVFHFRLGWLTHKYYKVNQRRLKNFMSLAWANDIKTVCPNACTYTWENSHKCSEKQG